MLHPLQSMIQSRQSGAKVGIPSYCSANELVLETALARAKASGQPVLIGHCQSGQPVRRLYRHASG